MFEAVPEEAANSWRGVHRTITLVGRPRAAATAVARGRARGGATAPPTSTTSSSPFSPSERISELEADPLSSHTLTRVRYASALAGAMAADPGTVVAGAVWVARCDQRT